MKKTFKVLGTQSRWLCAIAIVAVIGFSMTACGDEPDTGDPSPVYTSEQKEVITAGRLTITGLDDYNGKKIKAHGSWQEGSGETFRILGVYAYQTAYNTYWYTDGNLTSFSIGDTVEGTISGGQVTLKVYLYNPENSYHQTNYEPYAGNEQGVMFDATISITFSGDNDTVNGYVYDVNFSNGIGSGTFTPQ